MDASTAATTNEEAEGGPMARDAKAKRKRRGSRRTFKQMKERARQKAKIGPSSVDGSKMPQKKFFRSRAHCNPLSHNNALEYPSHPCLMDWSAVFDTTRKTVDFVDVGCGFGGLTVALAKNFSGKVSLGMEIRPKVTEYVRRKIQALQKEHRGENLYKNAGVMNTNAMKYLPNYFYKGQLSKMFFCFADPHFKRKNHRRRIISEGLLPVYTYLLKPGGILYTITDVEQLHQWQRDCCDKDPCLEKLTEEELSKDLCVQLMSTTTEESKKVDREGKFGYKKYIACYRRKEDEDTVTNPWEVLTVEKDIVAEDDEARAAPKV
jgi:tRNA (guanine-N7-)-methyltransferase|eukprot:g323.t1